MFKKKMLDYLLIPDSSRKTKDERGKRAVEELKKRRIRKILILKGRDSEEDILYLGKILKKGDRIGFDTFPFHYQEYKELIKKAKKYGEFPKGIKVENVSTKPSFKQKIYGILGLEEEKIKKRKLEYRKNRHEKSLEKIKGFVKRLIG